MLCVDAFIYAMCNKNELFLSKIFRRTKVTKFFGGDEKFYPTNNLVGQKISPTFFLSDKVIKILPKLQIKTSIISNL